MGTETVGYGDTLNVTGRTYAHDIIETTIYPPTGNSPQPVIDLDGYRVRVGEIKVDWATHINVNGFARVGQIDTGPVYGVTTIDIAAHSRLAATLNGHGNIDNNVTIFGAARDSVFINDGPSFISNGYFNANIGGHGSMTVGTLIMFGHGVGHYQTIKVNKGSSITVDRPDEFHALVTGNTLGGVLLQSVHGDSFTYRHDMLRIYEAGKDVENLRLKTASAFTLRATPSGTYISGTTGPLEHHGVVIPLPHLVFG